MPSTTLLATKESNIKSGLEFESTLIPVIVNDEPRTTAENSQLFRPTMVSAPSGIETETPKTVTETLTGMETQPRTVPPMVHLTTTESSVKQTASITTAAPTRKVPSSPSGTETAVEIIPETASTMKMAKTPLVHIKTTEHPVKETTAMVTPTTKVSSSPTGMETATTTPLDMQTTASPIPERTLPAAVQTDEPSLIDPVTLPPTSTESMMTTSVPMVTATARSSQTLQPPETPTDVSDSVLGFVGVHNLWKFLSCF